jgi:periplasmic protein TonB
VKTPSFSAPDGETGTHVFTQSLLESSAPTRRRWTTAVSFVAQAAAVAMLVALPMFYTQALPKVISLGAVLGPPRGEAPPFQATERRSSRTPHSEVIDNTVQQPIYIRKGVVEIHDAGRPEPRSSGAGPAVPYGIGSGDGELGIMALLPAPPRPSPPPTRPARPFPISGGVSQGLLIQQVRPAYPAMAIAAHVQGAVVLSAVISHGGTIENLRLVSGHPLLVPAAVDAVRQWRYRPYLLNGEPVEVETQITVNFTLGGG